MRFIGHLLAAIVLIAAISFGLNYLGLVKFRFFAPRYENARREVFENTQSYVEGKRQALTKHYNEWRKADSAEKNAIRAVVLQEFANFDIDKLTPTQYGWYKQIID